MSLRGFELERIGVEHRMYDQPFGLAAELVTNTLMWSAAGYSAIRRADLADGDNVRLVSAGDTRDKWSVQGPWGIAMQLRMQLHHHVHRTYTVAAALRAGARVLGGS